MTLNVLIVDDSSFFQSRLKNIINEHPDLNVIGVADNGRDAIEKVKQLHPDIVTMDYEMPMMDGVTAVRNIMAENPLPILMLSSMTYEGARITLDALDAGAVDFMTKNFSEISNNSPNIKKRIYEALLSIGGSSVKKKRSINESPVIVSRTPVEPIKPISSSVAVKSSPATGNPKIIVIGASTGGPAALTELLKPIPVGYPLPIVIVQHMPETFTKAFAERLNRQCQLEVKEAENGDQLLPGRILLTPGGKQLIIDGRQKDRIKIIDSDKPVNYKPCVDITFASVSNTYGADSLAIVMTGMGSDGCDGARLLKASGAHVWTQSESSCLIYGMPMAVDKAGLADSSFDINGLREQMQAVAKVRLH